MGQNINQYPEDVDIQGDDFLLGSDFKTGVTYSYPIQRIVDLIAASGSSIVGIKVLTVQETQTLNFIQVINTDASGTQTFGPGEVGIIDVYEWKAAAFKATYLLIKNEIVSITYGNSQSQMALTDLVPLRVASELSKETTGVNGGGAGSKSLVLSNAADYQIAFKGLVNGTGTEVVADGNNLKVNVTADVGEANTLVDAEDAEGNVSLAGVKAGTELKVKTLKISGATVTDNTTYVDIKISDKISVTDSFTLSDTVHKGTEIWCKNTAPIEITIPSSLSGDFDCGIYQKGAFQVKFLAGSGATILGGKNTVSAQFGSVLVTADPDVPTDVALLGDLITT